MSTLLPAEGAETGADRDGAAVATCWVCQDAGRQDGVMGDVVVRDRLALALWRFACPPKLRDEWATDPPPVFVRMADAVVAELAAIRAEKVEAEAAAAIAKPVSALSACIAAFRAELNAEQLSRRAEWAIAAEERARLEEAAAGFRVSAAVPGGVSAPVDLVVVEGPSAGVRVALDRPKLVIGRAEECDVRLADELVSPRHARLVWEPPRDGLWSAGRWLIEDLGSVNGTFVGGTRAFTRLPVAAGVRVQVGGSVFVLQLSCGPDVLHGCGV